MSASRTRRWWLITALALGVVIAVASIRRLVHLDGTLYDASIFSGWSLFTLLAALAACLWFPRLEGPAFRLQVRWFALLTGAAALLFAGHVQTLPPIGAVDRALAVLFSAMLVSSLWGFVLARRLERQSPRRLARGLQRWLLIQAALVGCLLGAGAVHGAVIHAHGLLAGLTEG